MADLPRPSDPAERGDFAMTDREPGGHLFIDTEALLEKAGNTGALTVPFVIDIVTVIWWLGKEPIIPDAWQIVDRLNRKLPGRKYTVEQFEAHRDDIEGCFTILSDGRWVPSPELFSLVDDDERA